MAQIASTSFLNPMVSWKMRLQSVVATMRDISMHSDPQQMVQAYGSRMRQMMPTDRFLAISRRNVQAPRYRITRSSLWAKAIDPWKQPGLLPELAGGLLGKLLYDQQPAIIDDLQVEADDPAIEHFNDMKSLIAIPHYDSGNVLNMVIMLRRETGGFPLDSLPEQVLISNLFGRATQNLVSSHRVKEAYKSVDRELQVVADIQRSLLPEKLPDIQCLELAAHYQTSRRAGGDYYDFFPLPGAKGEPQHSPNGRWGILIADVSGHGTPAAVLMAVTHSIAHTCCEEPQSPGALLRFVNEHLCRRYTNGNGTFVTAFYGIYDPASRELRYASAGHCPPRLRRAGGLASLEAARYLPLGIEPDEPYGEVSCPLEPGDLLVLYTDGITEARNDLGELLGMDRLDTAVLNAPQSAPGVVQAILKAVDHFEAGAIAADDKTILAIRVK